MPGVWPHPPRAICGSELFNRLLKTRAVSLSGLPKPMTKTCYGVLTGSVTVV
jgi:hypothetical protein